MADENLVTTQDLVAQSIDFVEQFSDSVNGLLTALQGVRKVPMANGSVVKTYKTTVKPASSSTVAEGEVIPLTKVTRKVDQNYTLTLTDKLRKVTTFEAIQQSGFTRAVSDTDAKLLNTARKDVKSGLFKALDTNAATKVTGAKNLQQAISKGLGKVTGIFEDLDGAGSTVAFVNPDDFYNWLGNQQISVQNTFGFMYLKNFLNVDTVILTTGVSAGTVYVTVNNNLNLYYVDMNGQAGNALGLTTEQSGLIGVKHSVLDDSLSYQTVAAGGWLFIPENSTGIVKVSIDAAEAVGDKAK